MTKNSLWVWVWLLINRKTPINLNNFFLTSKKAIQREESYEEQIRDISARLKDVSFENRKWLKKFSFPFLKNNIND